MGRSCLTAGGAVAVAAAPVRCMLCVTVQCRHIQASDCCDSHSGSEITLELCVTSVEATRLIVAACDASQHATAGVLSRLWTHNGSTVMHGWMPGSLGLVSRGPDPGGSEQPTCGKAVLRTYFNVLASAVCSIDGLCCTQAAQLSGLFFAASRAAGCTDAGYGTCQGTAQHSTAQRSTAQRSAGMIIVAGYFVT